jgi:toxin ParE1/3/4
MKVHWTATALDRLLTIYEYIAKDSPMYAQRMVDRLTRRSEQVGIYPQSGRMVPEYEMEDIREVIEKPYRLIYRTKTGQVDILTVLHSAQLLSSDME